MTFSKTERLARQWARRKIKRLRIVKSKWPEEWENDRIRYTRGPLVTLQHQVHELQLILFRANERDGWYHARDELTVVSERSIEGADADLTFNDDNYFA